MKRLQPVFWKSVFVVSLLSSMGVTGNGCGGGTDVEGYDSSAGYVADEVLNTVSFKLNEGVAQEGSELFIELFKKDSDEKIARSFSLDKSDAAVYMKMEDAVYNIKSTLTIGASSLEAHQQEVIDKDHTDVEITFVIVDQRSDASFDLGIVLVDRDEARARCMTGGMPILDNGVNIGWNSDPTEGQCTDYTPNDFGDFRGGLNEWIIDEGDLGGFGGDLEGDDDKWNGCVSDCDRVANGDWIIFMNCLRTDCGST
jgi:hypothetical protein